LATFTSDDPPQSGGDLDQSSLASLPAMLDAANQLRVPQRNADVTLPLPWPVQATGAMNISVAIYVAYWMGIELMPSNLIAASRLASIASYWAVSLPAPCRSSPRSLRSRWHGRADRAAALLIWSKSCPTSSARSAM
jgi:hypothetical protein